MIKGLVIGMILAFSMTSLFAYYDSSDGPEHLSWNLTTPEELIFSYEDCVCP